MTGMETSQVAKISVGFTIQNDASLIEPFTGLTLLPFDSIDTKIFEYTFSGAEPIGSYQIGGRLLHPFSGDAISTDIEILTLSIDVSHQKKLTEANFMDETYWCRVLAQVDAWLSYQYQE